MSNYINHITLSTGHCRRSPRSEVSDATLDILRPWLLDLVESAGKSPLPVAELSHFSALAIVEVGLVVTIYGPSGPYISGRPNKTDGAPIVTIGVAQRTRQGSELWSKLSKHFVTVAGLGVLSPNPRNFRHPRSRSATSASRSIILPSLWKV